MIHEEILFPYQGLLQCQLRATSWLTKMHLMDLVWCCVAEGSEGILKVFAIWSISMCTIWRRKHLENILELVHLLNLISRQDGRVRFQWWCNIALFSWCAWWVGSQVISFVLQTVGLWWSDSIDIRRGHSDLEDLLVLAVAYCEGLSDYSIRL